MDENFVLRKVSKSVMTYMAYFGSRFIGNDIQVLCGNLLDTPLMKSFSLFCILHNTIDNMNIALAMSIFFVLFQYLMSILPACNKYTDKTIVKNVNNYATAWPKVTESPFHESGHV